MGKKLFAIAIILVLVSMAFAVDATMAGGSSQPINCRAACAYRCSKASRAKLCLKDCNICCGKCNCVPPGTAGNREVCPCYANLKNSKGTGKCP